MAAGVLVLAAATGAMVLPAGAVPEPVSTSLVGEFSTPAATFDLASGENRFVGTWDPETGDFTGMFEFEAVLVHAEPPVTSLPVDVLVQLQQPTAGTGSVDLLTNEVTFDAPDMRLALLYVYATGTPLEGTIAPCNYAFPFELTGTYDPDTGIVTLEDAQITSAAILEPGIPPNERCFWTGTGTDARTITDAAIVGTENSFNTSFDIGDASALPPPPPVVPTPPAAPPAAPPAEPTTVAPTFTG